MDGHVVMAMVDPVEMGARSSELLIGLMGKVLLKKQLEPVLKGALSARDFITQFRRGHSVGGDGIDSISWRCCK